MNQTIEWYERKVIRHNRKATCVMHINPDGTEVLHPIWVDDCGMDFDVLHEIKLEANKRGGITVHVVRYDNNYHHVTEAAYKQITEKNRHALIFAAVSFSVLTVSFLLWLL